MKKVLFSRIMLCLAVLGSMFVVSACSIFKEDVNVVSFEIIEETLPDVIVVGDFDNAGIKARVIYSDDTSAEVDVTSQMIPEEYKSCLDTVGIYKIAIAFRGQTDELVVRMANNTNLYQVNFYDAKNRIISTRFVYGGETAELPSATISSMRGYAFMGWDRSNENIIEDTNIYGLYVNIENTLSNSKMQQVMLDVEKAYNASSHFTSVEIIDYKSDVSDKATINYHYNEETGASTSQITMIDDSSSFVVLMGENDAEFWQFSNNEKLYTYGNYEEAKKTEYLGKEELFDQMISRSKLWYDLDINDSYDKTFFNALLSVGKAEYSYEIVLNRVVYTCEITMPENNNIVEKYVIKYDESVLLQFTKSNYTVDTNELVSENIVSADYTTVAFEEDLIPNFGDVNQDGVVDNLDVDLIDKYILGELELTEEQLMNADVLLDNYVDGVDKKFIQGYIDGDILRLPLDDAAILLTIMNYSNEDVTGTFDAFVVKYDSDNKIIIGCPSDASNYYCWESNGIEYIALDEGDGYVCRISNDDMIANFKWSMYSFEDVMLTGGIGRNYKYGEYTTIRNADGNFVLEVEAQSPEGEVLGTIKYIFNDNGIISFEGVDGGIATYDYSELDLEIPEEIKALESTAS